MIRDRSLFMPVASTEENLVGESISWFVKGWVKSNVLLLKVFTNSYQN